jgi:hypothetical protein
MSRIRIRKVRVRIWRSVKKILRNRNDSENKSTKKETILENVNKKRLKGERKQFTDQILTPVMFKIRITRYSAIYVPVFMAIGVKQKLPRDCRTNKVNTRDTTLHAVSDYDPLAKFASQNISKYNLIIQRPWQKAHEINF